MSGFIAWLDEVDRNDVNFVGGKGSSLGELRRHLGSQGVDVPGGFVITTEGYRYFVRESGIEEQVCALLQALNPNDIQDLTKRGAKIRALFHESTIPRELRLEIERAYCHLSRAGREIDVAVRSSATSEDLKEASFAGQHDTFLNVKGEAELMQRVKNCFASLFTDRAIAYRAEHGFDHCQAALGIVVQEMVRSDLASSGVLFTIDPETGFKDVIYITSSYGFGELVVQGQVNPDQIYVFKPTLLRGKKAIIEKKLGSKQTKLIYSDDHGMKQVQVPLQDRGCFSLTEAEIIQLAQWGLLIEKHYGMPMDIEWAKDGTTNGLYIVQARPETVHASQEANVLETYVLEEKGRLLIQGEAVGSKVGRGPANVILDVKDITRFKEGEVLVTDKTDPDWEPIMKIASAIVTNRGGRTSHAAIVSRELGLPAVIGTEHATDVIETGQGITVDCSEGLGRIYEGLLRFRIERVDLKEIPRTRTKIMMNVGLPEQALQQSKIPTDGVGLAREEFIISSHIGIHPSALIDYQELQQKSQTNGAIAEVVRRIDERTAHYEDKVQFFIAQLASGIAKIAAAFWPNDVIVRFSDFKTNEYAGLIGGSLYEPSESNPMLGWRGASRYYDPKFKEAFGLECQAVARVRNEMGLTNVKVMVPFCRTVEEGRKVIQTMGEFGLNQGENGLEIYVMCEIPSNVLLAGQFAEIFDGFSIGSNDLTQLTLGLDRDSELVSHLYDERNEAVKMLLRQVITTVKSKGRKIGICGQAPSDFPEFAEFLVECGIHSISLNPDTVIKTRLLIAEKERELGRGAM